MTGRDLYIETSMNTNDYFVRGLANSGKVCSSTENCLVVEGTKIHVAPIVVTHELGHALGMTYDDRIEGNDKVKLDDYRSNISFLCFEINLQDIKYFEISIASIKHVHN